MDSPKKKPPVREDLLNNARAMRRESTDAEEKLWWLVRSRRLGGFKFRRQHLVGGYILDFYCQECLLGVELDGGQHDEDAMRAHDELRTADLRNRGIEVIRFWNNEVLQDTDVVAEKILEICEGRATGPRPHPNPLPEGEGTNAGPPAAGAP